MKKIIGKKIEKIAINYVIMERNCGKYFARITKLFHIISQ